MESIKADKHTTATDYQIKKNASKFAFPGDEVSISGRRWQVNQGCIRLCEMCESGIRERVICDKIDHGLCQGCDQELTERRCSFCYTEESSVEALVREIHNQSLSRIADECTYQCLEDECTWKGQYSDIARHLDTCGPHIYPCQFKDYGCEQRGTKDKLSEHIINCPYRETVCTKCHQSYSIWPEKAKEHVDNCPNRQEICAFDLSRAGWQFLATVAQWASLDLDALQTAVTAEQTLLQEQGAKLAAALQNRKPIDLMCDYRCGAILTHPDQFLKHYQETCPNVLINCPSCRARRPRKDLNEHMQYCPHVPVFCPRHCGETPARRHIQSGEHDLTCANTPVQCEHCGENMTRKRLQIHQRECRMAPYLCRYCGLSMPLLARESHTESCPNSQPFELADHRYVLQPGANTLIYQRADGDLRVSHVCIPTTKAVLMSWFNDNVAQLNFQLGLERTDPVQFQLAGKELKCLLRESPARFEEVTALNHSTVNTYLVDAQGRYLSDLYTCAKSRSYCLLLSTDKASIKKAIQALSTLEEQSKVFLLISRVPYSSLFTDALETSPDKKARHSGSV